MAVGAAEIRVRRILACVDDAAADGARAREMLEQSADWENMYLGAGSPDNILLVGFKSDRLKPLTGKTLAEVVAMVIHMSLPTKTPASWPSLC